MTRPTYGELSEELSRMLRNLSRSIRRGEFYDKDETDDALWLLVTAASDRERERLRNATDDTIKTMEKEEADTFIGDFILSIFDTPREDGT